MNKFCSSNIQDNIITFTVLKSTPTREEWDLSKKNILEWYDYLENNQMRAGLIFNLEELIYINPTYLLEWKELFITNGERTKINIIASSIIVDNNIIRQVVNMFFKIYDPIRPMCIVKDIETACNFINQNIYN